MQGIVGRFYDMNEQTTILMILLTNHDLKSNCAIKKHGYCRIAHMLLKLLDKKEVNRLLEVTALRNGKTVLHMVVATGHPCQLRVLLALTSEFWQEHRVTWDYFQRGEQGSNQKKIFEGSEIFLILRDKKASPSFLDFVGGGLFLFPNFKFLIYTYSRYKSKYF